ncbi:membrane protein [Nocardia neocaledoniensis NBRC 108232]|uniref:DoxX-like protein n=1 Tax=Nocardia neocaledoniensis TaxID=236511 RepID=A0A317NLL1_9NOCA|nr:DoxX family protein [Nocardia neocaledoniensis]PWV75985.1 DoxX-like protein [Nocardia neocaledoniensis]GEM30618.1 membrane protein [Nocardia neocaledoniensis NBRC 108232]
MLALYIALTALTALLMAAGSWMGYTHHPIPVAAAAKVGVPHSWMFPIATCLGAAALGLLTGFVLPPVGVAASAGLILYFIGAVIAHLRVGDHALSQPLAFLALSAATCTATVLYRYA